MRGRRRTPGRPVTYATTDAFLEHFGLASLADLPGAAEMKAAGLLDLDLPPDFAVPDPSAAAPDEDPLDDEATREFHTDFLGRERLRRRVRGCEPDAPSRCPERWPWP